MIKILNLGEYIISNNFDDVIKIVALGSCIAFIIYDHFLKIAAMAHITLPTSKILHSNNLDEFADVIIPKMINILNQEYKSYRYNWDISIFGGSKILKNNSYDIGFKNIQKVKELIEQYDLKCIQEDIGGNYSRTVEVNVNTGEIILSRIEVN